MTYPAHYLLSFGGALFGGEEWANNIRFVGGVDGTTGSITNYEGALDDLEADLRAHVTSPNSGYSSAAFVDWIKFNEIDENGRYADPAASHTRFLDATTRFRNTSGPSVPAQVALVVSFTTARQRGHASKGRIYIPAPSAAFDTGSGQVAAARTQAIADAWATFLTNLRNWPGMDWPNSPVPAVVSNVGAPGPAEQITGVRVGSVLDTQRRRRADLVESYATASVA